MEIVDQDINLILPSTRVHMVLMQPFIYFENPYTEPYRWERRKRDAQIAAIFRTLGIARALGDGKHAHFTIFPEYSIPGLHGVGTIDEVLGSENWPSDTVVIGGVDGLTAEEYRRLCAMAATEHAACNAPENVVDDNWVNVAVTWIKDSNGHVTKWVQPKLKPSELERNTPCRNMHEGRSVFLFSAMFDNNSPCRFLTLVCFDWIASIEGENTQDLILSDLEERWNQGDPRALHWVFVIQQNTDPNHSEFIRRTEDFLLDHHRYPHVNRRDTSVVMANNALHETKSERSAGAFSSFIFAPNAPFVWDECRPTVSVSYTRYRRNGGFNRCNDVTFREMAPCVQWATVSVVPWAPTRTQDRSSAVVGGNVSPLEGPTQDPRFPSRPVPPTVKWVNDELDDVERLGENDMAGTPLQNEVTDSQEKIVRDYRVLDHPLLTSRIRQAAWLTNENLTKVNNCVFENVDLWDVNEQSALELIIQSLSIIGACCRVNVTDSPGHASVDLTEGVLHVFAVRGPTHEDCRKHFDRTFRCSEPGAVLLITRDANNLIPTGREVRKIYESIKHESFRHKAYQELINDSRRAQSADDLRTFLKDVLEPTNARFI